MRSIDQLDDDVLDDVCVSRWVTSPWAINFLSRGGATSRTAVEAPIRAAHPGSLGTLACGKRSAHECASSCSCEVGIGLARGVGSKAAPSMALLADKSKMKVM